MTYPCPVCDYAMDDTPEDYNICPRCHTEFEYHDSGNSYEELRKRWQEKSVTSRSAVFPTSAPRCNPTSRCQTARTAAPADPAASGERSEK